MWKAKCLREFFTRRSTRPPILISLLLIGLLTTVGCSSLKKQLLGSQDPVISGGNPADRAALVSHLISKGARLYSTFWCTYCKQQKALFSEAASLMKSVEVECDPNGKNAQPSICAKAQVSSYPTWEIDGKLYFGMRSLQDLAQLSGYQGSQDFGDMVGGGR